MPNKKILNITPLILTLLLTPKVWADSTPPLTTISKNPINPNGSENWYTTPVQITLNGTDLESGIKEINYRVNSGEWEKSSFYQTLNLAPNPSFENNGFAGWDVSVLDQYISASIDNTTYAPSFNNTSIKLISSGMGWHGIHNLNNFAVAEPYINMTASAWIKTNGVSQTAYFKIYAVSMDENNNIVKTYLGQSSTTNGTEDWIKVSSTFTTSHANTIGIVLDIGLEGTGTIWVDAINISKATLQPQASFYMSNDGNNNVQYYSIDQAGNIETTKNIDIKIDQTPPQNWNTTTTTHNLSDPEYVLTVQTSVEDTTSGLSNLTKEFQYKTETSYGTYSNIVDCESIWNEDNWNTLSTYPVNSGNHSSTLATPKISFCDNLWNKCKSVRFKAIDVAGNESTKEYCINGPWIKTSNGGKVKANYGINMTAEAPEDNSDGLIESGTTLAEFFKTSNNHIAKESTKLNNSSYENLWNKTTNKTEVTELNTNSGIYYVTGNLTINSLPSNFSTSNFDQIIFVDGKLIINTDIEISNTSTLLFVVKGDIEINKTVENIQSAIYTDENFYTAYDINQFEITLPLELKGSFSANKFYLQRNLTLNNIPTEHFIYEPKYLINLKPYIKESQIEWHN